MFLMKNVHVHVYELKVFNFLAMTSILLSMYELNNYSSTMNYICTMHSQSKYMIQGRIITEEDIRRYLPVLQWFILTQSWFK